MVAALYARVPKDRVLEHEGRDRVYQLVQAEPGVSTNRLAAVVDFGWSTLTYHLRVLERTEKIVSVRDGRHKRFFDRESGRFANGRKTLVSVLKNSATLDIARYILEQPGVTQKDVGTRFGLAPSSVHWHVNRLSEAELVEKQRDRHRVRYFPGTSWSQVSPLDVGLPDGLIPLSNGGSPVANA
jgi:predicted transcriptional regulator